MELAFEARVSPRHVSFIETGRSRPSREAILAISSVLGIPLRERNVLLESAGHSREYPEAPFDAGENAHLRSILSRLLIGHEPWFAVVIDHHWDILLANDPAESLLRAYFDIGGVPGPRNLMRLTLHPEGLRPAIKNLEPVAGRLLTTLEREASVRPDDERLAALFKEISEFGPEGRDSRHWVEGTPMHLETDCGDVSLLTLLMTFDNPLDPVTEEIRIETLLPQDAESGRILKEALSRLAQT